MGDIANGSKNTLKLGQSQSSLGSKTNQDELGGCNDEKVEHSRPNIGSKNELKTHFRRITSARQSSEKLNNRQKVKRVTFIRLKKSYDKCFDAIFNENKQEEKKHMNNMLDASEILNNFTNDAEMSERMDNILKEVKDRNTDRDTDAATGEQPILSIDAKAKFCGLCRNSMSSIDTEKKCQCNNNKYLKRNYTYKIKKYFSNLELLRDITYINKFSKKNNNN